MIGIVKQKRPPQFLTPRVNTVPSCCENHCWFARVFNFGVAVLFGACVPFKFLYYVIWWFLQSETIKNYQNLSITLLNRKNNNLVVIFINYDRVSMISIHNWPFTGYWRTMDMKCIRKKCKRSNGTSSFFNSFNTEWV